MTPIRSFTVPLPARMRRLPVDSRGFPVPWFVTWFEDGKPVADGIGTPDFRIIGPGKIVTAVKSRRCWICGDLLGSNKAFVIGPMCAINRTISEPPSHLDCARFAARCCPFLSQPRMKRNSRELPDEHQSAPGHGILRNPGVACVWSTRSFTPFEAGNGMLFRLGDPVLVEWWAEGREATQAEVTASISSGFPLLVEEAEREGLPALRALGAYLQRAIPLLPA